MSAPLVVNTRDGVCWTRRTVTSSGIALYAPEGVCGCPEFVMATLSELAVHGIVGSADVLPVPVPVGPAPRTLDVVEDELTGVSLSLYEEELTSERLRWALASAKRGRARLRAQVAELNESVSSAAEALRARSSCPCPPADLPGPHQLGCPQAEVPLKGRARLDTSAAAAAEATHWKRLGVEDPHDSPLHHPYRVGHDLDMPGGGA